MANGHNHYGEFKESSVALRVKKMVDIRESLDAKGLHVKLSYNNSKTGALVPSVSLIPVADCGNCKLCSRGCYDIRNVCRHTNTQKQRANKSAIFKQDRVRYFKEIELQAHFLRFFRWHVGGDIKDYDYLAGMVQVAEAVPECQFLAFTKMFKVVNDYLDLNGSFPENLHIILSGWRGDTFENPHNLPVSSPLWADGSKSCMATEDAEMCPGDCTACASFNGGCWSAGKGHTILFNAH